MTGRAPVKLSIVYRAPEQVPRRVSTVSIIIPFYLTHNSSEDLWAVSSTGSLLKSDRALDLGKRSHHAPTTFSGTALPPSMYQSKYSDGTFAYSLDSESFVSKSEGGVGGLLADVAEKLKLEDDDASSSNSWSQFCTL
jgi:hypothetical protein